PLAGFIVGDAAFRRARLSAVWIVRLAATGIGLMGVCAVAVVAGPMMPRVLAKYYMNGITMYPGSTEYVLGTLGLGMFCLAVLHSWIDLNPRMTSTGVVLRFWQRWSAFSLTIYIVHLAVHLWPLWLYAVAMGKDDPTFYWRKAMSTPAAL